jgi:hypothetical protein
VHSNEIANIWESIGAQVYYQQDEVGFDRAEERRWITATDERQQRLAPHRTYGPAHQAPFSARAVMAPFVAQENSRGRH